MQSPRKAAFIFVFITVALDMLAIGIVIPVLPNLIETFLAGDAARAAKYVGLFATIFAAVQFVVSPLLGALSDRFGRRPVILLSNLGLGLDYLIVALAPSLWFLLVARFLAGATSASVATAGAYIADVTTPDRRAQYFGLLSAGFGLGFVLGPVIGGLLGAIDLRYPFWAAAAMSLVNFVYGYFILPESLKPENRAPFTWRKASPMASLRLLLGGRELWSFGSAIFLSQLAHTVLPAVFVLYASYRYDWGPYESGLLLAAVGTASVVVQGTCVKPLVRSMGEVSAAVFGLLMGSLALFWYGFSTESWLVWFAVPIAAFWGLFNATSQSIMSRNVGADEQGKLQGANTSIKALANILGPSLFAYAFALGVSPDRGWSAPGLAFWLAGGFLLLAALIAVAVSAPRRAPAE
jgi:DHA1 family tetracycline resistance protein-like MFS transporter